MHVLHRLTSKEKLKILSLIREGVKHPAEMAARLGITRQGVDKHLGEMYALGVVEKAWAIDNRPRVEYFLSPLGEFFYGRAEALAREYAERVREFAEEEIRRLDEQLVLGEITEEEHRARVKEIKNRFSWAYE